MDSIVTVTPPAIEPITTAEARRQLRMGSSAGEPAPTALTAALAGAGAGNVDNGAHRYAVTFVTADGETELGEFSAELTVSDKSTNGQVALTNIPLGGSFVTSRKIYRTLAGGSLYALLTTLANNTATTYTDNTADSGLGAQAPSTNSTVNPESTSWIQASREIGETFTRRRWIDQTLDWKLDDFTSHLAADGSLYLPVGCVTAIGSITYLDTDGVSTVWASSKYRTDLPTGAKCPRGRIEPAYGENWPNTRSVIAAVTIRMTVGYGTARSSVPEGLKVGMKALIGFWDANRGGDKPTDDNSLPRYVKSAWLPFRTH